MDSYGFGVGVSGVSDWVVDSDFDDTTDIEQGYRDGEVIGLGCIWKNARPPAE